jgi:hypothetical protein
VRSVIGEEVPPGVVVVTVGADGGPAVDSGPARPVIAGGSVTLDVVVESRLGDDVVVDVAGRLVPVAAGATVIAWAEVGHAEPTFAVGSAAMR